MVVVWWCGAGGGVAVAWRWRAGGVEVAWWWRGGGVMAASGGSTCVRVEGGEAQLLTEHLVLGVTEEARIPVLDDVLVGGRRALGMKAWRAGGERR